jgi:hypothetical protein
MEILKTGSSFFLMNTENNNRQEGESRRQDGTKVMSV